MIKNLCMTELLQLEYCFVACHIAIPESIRTCMVSCVVKKIMNALLDRANFQGRFSSARSTHKFLYYICNNYTGTMDLISILGKKAKYEKGLRVRLIQTNKKLLY